MKKIVTIGAVTMMGFTAVGGLQKLAQATENYNGPVTGMVNIFTKDLFGTTAYADEVQYAKENAFYIESSKSNCFSVSRNEQGVLNYWKTTEGKDFDVTIIAPDGTKEAVDESKITSVDSWENVSETLLTEGYKVLIVTKTKCHGGMLDYYKNSALYGQTFEANQSILLSVNADGTMKVMQEDQNAQTDVIFEHTETPGEPGWYGIVPANITFNDENSDEQLDATVKIVNANDQKTAYSGSKTVDVKVKSTNGFDLKDGDKEAVEYSITKKDGDAVTKNTDEQDLGTMDKATPTIASKASLKGEAKESGKFVDTLTYHFIEQ